MIAYKTPYGKRIIEREEGVVGRGKRKDRCLRFIQGLVTCLYTLVEPTFDTIVLEFCF